MLYAKLKKEVDFKKERSLARVKFINPLNKHKLGSHELFMYMAEDAYFPVEERELE